MQFDRLKRREFISLLGGAAAWPLPVRAQRAPNRPIIGFLNSGLPGGYAPFATAFRQGLAEAGFVEGQNVVIEYRWAEGQYDRLPMMAADLIQRQVTVIAATSTPAALAVKAMTSVIPIVFTVALDPVAAGLVVSLNRPGGNATGVSNYLSDLGAKRLELLHEVVPKTTVIGMLVNPNYPDAEVQRKDAAEAAHKLGVELHVVNASTEGDFNSAFANLVQLTAGALLVGTDTFLLSRRDQLVLLAARHAIPAMYFLREFALAGGLMSYAANLHDGYRQAGIYTGRILNGAKPADLPVVQPTKFDLVMNINTAKVLGLEIPARLLALADEVIE
jgi:putative ABC transport system substrate-binding protein